MVDGVKHFWDRQFYHGGEGCWSGRLYSPHFDLALVLADLREVVVGLQTEPELSRTAERLRPIPRDVCWSGPTEFPRLSFPSRRGIA